uniref:Zinc finger protein 865 n=1 Tax=Timema shepardi TaxID=629360 RepID=A0A7R9B579_TIMSH|nr:unnamed protein product [Timema shepardi]
MEPAPYAGIVPVTDINPDQFPTEIEIKELANALVVLSSTAEDGEIEEDPCDPCPSAAMEEPVKIEIIKQEDSSLELPSSGYDVNKSSTKIISGSPPVCKCCKAACESVFCWSEHCDDCRATKEMFVMVKDLSSAGGDYDWSTVNLCLVGADSDWSNVNVDSANLDDKLLTLDLGSVRAADSSVSLQEKTKNKDRYSKKLSSPTNVVSKEMCASTPKLKSNKKVFIPNKVTQKPFSKNSSTKFPIYIDLTNSSGEHSESSNSKESVGDSFRTNEPLDRSDQETNELTQNDWEVSSSSDYSSEVSGLIYSNSDDKRCKYCGVIIPQLEELAIHLTQHYKEKPFLCNVCGAIFKLKTQLTVHTFTHTRETIFTCDICKSGFYTKGHLRCHMLTHTGERPYECPTCGARFNQSSHLKRHVHVHDSNRPKKRAPRAKKYFCEKCDAKFTTVASSKLHMLYAHEGLVKYSCSHCSAEFYHKANLNSHLRTHTGERPFRCTVCDVSFKQSSHLLRHSWIHSGKKPYPCSFCDMSFRQKFSLKCHTYTHTGEKPWAKPPLRHQGRGVSTTLCSQGRFACQPLLAVCPVSTWLQQRDYSVNRINSNMTLMSADQGSQPADTRTLVVMFPWLLAKERQVAKYADFYTSQGFDVLTVSITPWQMLWPVKGCQPVMEELLKFLHDCQHRKLLLHGFSVGVYLWGEALNKINQDMERYKPVVERIVGQIWDSGADITEIPVGFPQALFPRSPTLQAAMGSCVRTHMRVFHDAATQHYIRASQTFYAGIVHAPALFLVSKADPIGTERNSRRCAEGWEALGMKVYVKCWDDSPHIGHFRKYPEEYLAQLVLFLGRADLIPCQEKLQAKL